jgi:hypothetical protein
LMRLMTSSFWAAQKRCVKNSGSPTEKVFKWRHQQK